MALKNLPTLDPQTRGSWREWLAANHTASPGVWLTFLKPKSSMTYNDSVEEALCFGWVDSLIKRIDDERYARLFTPRKPDSKWSTLNRRRYADMRSRGLLAPAGVERPPTDRSGDAPRPAGVPPYFERELKKHAAARAAFERLRPSHRRQYIAWVDSAKKEETKLRRLGEAIRMLTEGKRLGI